MGERVLGFVINVVFSALVIGAATYLSRRYPGTAGFVAALPLTTMLLFALGRAQHGEAFESARLGKSMLLAIPLSSTFLLPFVFGPKLNLSFGLSYLAGIGLLVLGFVLHRALIGG